ncbi:MAG: hypothetical protein DWQ06_08695 [Calditrichaeota bacterium]|nr:MAG: hypothetical protein DWQ06_08695 [Calditrichota bacterium]
MFIQRHETEVLQKKLSQAIENGIGSTILISGEPGIGKTTLIKNFMDNCDKASEKNVLTAIGSCLDMDGVSRGFLPWREVLIELDADKAAGKDEEKKSNFKKIVKTVFDEAGSQWLEAIPVIGDISSAIFETAKTISKDELIDTETGDSKKLALKDRLKNVAKECTGEWLNVIPVVGNLSAAIYKTTNAIQKSKQVTYSQNQQDFFVRVMHRFRELAESNPVVIYIDDLQWADISSMNLFFYLSKNLKDEPYPMVLIGSFRPQDIKDGRLNPISGEVERHPWEEKINNLQRYSAIDLVEVSYLDQSQIGSYIDLRFPQNEFSAKFKNEIATQTKGNSLFVRELLLNLEEREIIYEKDGMYFSDETLDLTTLPTTVSGVIEERFQRLKEELQEVLQIASVQGTDFSLEVIGTILEDSNLKLLKKVQELQKKYSLILKSETVYDKLTKIYNFTHNLVQKYIYYQINEDFRLEIHSMIVETLKNFFEGDEIYKVAEQYSFHFGVANEIIDENGKIIFSIEAYSEETLNEYLKFIKYLGEKYKDEYRNEEAIGKYLTIIEILKIKADNEAEIMAQIDISKIYTFIGKVDEAISVLKKCSEQAQNLSFKKLQGVAFNEIGVNLVYQGNFDEGMKYFLKQVEICNEIGEKDKILNVYGNMGVVYAEKGDYDNSIESFQKSLKIGKEIGDKKGIGNAIGNIGIVYTEKNELGKAMECFEEQQRIYEEIGDKNGVSIALGNMGRVYGSQKNPGKAIECYRKQIKICEKLGNKRGISIASGNIGSVFKGIKSYEKAMEYFQKKMILCKELGDNFGLSIVLGNIGEIHRINGEFDKTLENFDKAIEVLRNLGIPRYLCNQLMEKADLLFSTKKYENAKAINSEVQKLADKNNLNEFIDRSRSLAEKINSVI